jgi:hypothetical protein
MRVNCACGKGNDSVDVMFFIGQGGVREARYKTIQSARVR